MAPKITPILLRFVKNFDRKGDNDCWLWKGHTDKDGYGVLSTGRRIGGKKMLRAHRVALEIYLGRTLFEGMFACHRCDTPGCVNPAHLFEGSCGDNIRDCINKGRFTDFSGENNNSAKLTEHKVHRIRMLLKNGIMQKVVAKRFGVSRACVCLIDKRKTWESVV